MHGTATPTPATQATRTSTTQQIGSGGLESAEGGGNANEMPIIPDNQNNAVLIYVTPQENDTVEAMLRKLNILPLHVRIDAIVAEVGLGNTERWTTRSACLRAAATLMALTWLRCRTRL